MWSWLKEKLNKMWEKIKAWFNKSETIFLARLETVTGLVITVLSSMDWSPLLAFGVDTGFTWKQSAILGSIMLAKGLITEWARRRNTVVKNDQLLPTNARLK